MRDLRIMVHTTPNYHDNSKAPYFWCVFEHIEDVGLTNVGSGWAKTETKAFNAAKKWATSLNETLT